MNISTSPDPIPDRFSHVSSLYGPGNMGGWICVLISLFFTWTLNPKYSRSDHITADFVAALTIPVVATCHVYSLLYFRAPVTSSSGLKELFTSSDPASQRFASAVEAPLTVCEIFSGFAVALFAAAAWRRQMRRAVIILLVNILTWSTGLATVIKVGRSLPVQETNMVRPFCINFDRAPINAVMTTAVITIGLAMSGPVFSFAFCHPDDLSRRPSPASTEQGQSFGAKVRAWLCFPALRFSITVSFLKEKMHMVLPILSLPFLTLQTGIIIMGALSETKYMSRHQGLAVRLSFAIPKSSYRIAELDQAVCLFIGHVTLVFSLWDALKSRLRERLAAQRARGEQVGHELS